MTGDAAVDALRLAVAGDVPAAFTILTDHVRAADNPAQAMFVLAAGYAAIVQDEELARLSGRLPADDADLIRTLVVAVRSDDLVGAWYLCRMTNPGVLGVMLGGLLAAAALSSQRDAGL